MNSKAPGPQKILIASDHAGFALKKYLIETETNLPWEDLGTHDETSVDYPDFANRLAEKMPKSKGLSASQNINLTFAGETVGVLICGSGQGMAIRANRFPYIRAALCWTPEVAKWARGHNNANVLCLGQKCIEQNSALEILRVFLSTPFEGGRHERRVGKLSENC